jgi:hypothetical protein
VNDPRKVYPYTAYCQYDACRFDEETITAVLNVDPVLIVRSQLVKNANYHEAGVSLEEYRTRQRGDPND